MKSNELVRKEQVLNLLKNDFTVEEKTSQVIDKFLDKNGMVLRKSIPLIMKEVINDVKMEQIAIEEDIVDSLEDLDEDMKEPFLDVCAICIEILEDEIEALNCNHKYHRSCISQWMNQNPVCPECRAHIKPAKDFPPLARKIGI